MARDHIVPQMLLRRFADDRQRLLATPRTGGPRIPMTVARACRESGFYDIDIDPTYSSLVPHNQIERSLADFEGRAARLFARFTSGDASLSEQDRFDLMLFISFQAVRGWSFRAELSEVGTLMARQELEVRLTPEVVRARLEKEGRPHDRAAVDAWRDEMLTSNWKVVPSQSFAVQQMGLLALAVLHPDFYLRRRVRVLRFAEPSLLISDDPLVMWMRPDRPSNLPIGIGTADILYMPIDRRHALALCLSGHEGIIDADPVEADRINRLVGTHGHRWIFQHPQDAALDVSDLPEAPTWSVETLGVIVDGEEVRIQKRLVRRQPS
jgi:hypothetical protein